MDLAAFARGGGKKSPGTGSTLTDGLCDGFNFQGRYEPICARDLPEGDFDVVFFCGGYND